MKTVPVLALCAFLIGLDALLVVPLAPWMAASLGLSADRAAWLVTAYTGAYALGAPILGTLADGWGRARVLTAGLLVFATATVAVPLVRGLPLLLALRALAGLGAAMITPSLFALLGDAVPPARRGRATGLVYGAMISATVFGVPLGAWFAARGGWQSSFFLVGLASCAVLPWVRSTARRVARQRPLPVPPRRRSRAGGLLSDPAVRRTLAATFLWYAALYGFFADVGVFYARRFDVSLDALGSVILLAGAASVAGNVIGGRLADARGSRGVLRAAAWAAALALAVLAGGVRQLPYALLSHVAWAFLVGLGSAPLMSLVTGLRPSRRAGVLAWNSSAMYAGMTLASGMAGVLLPLWGFTGIGLGCALVYVAVALLSSRLPADEAAAPAPGSGTSATAQGDAQRP